MKEIRLEKSFLFLFPLRHAIILAVGDTNAEKKETKIKL